MYDYGLDL